MYEYIHTQTHKTQKHKYENLFSTSILKLELNKFC